MAEAIAAVECLSRLARAAGRAGFRGQVLARTAHGDVMAWERPAAGPRVYLSAGIHGDEPAGPLAALRLLEEGALRDDVHWLLCPALNPVGLALGTREAADGVDLNREYLRRRAAEVLGHVAWLEAGPPPDLFLSLHEDWESAGFYFYEINQGDDRPERASAILDAVAPWFPPESGPEIDGHAARAPGWIYHEAEADVPEGWPEAIFIAKAGCPLSFTFETPSAAALDRRISALRACVLAAVREVCEE